MNLKNITLTGLIAATLLAGCGQDGIDLNQQSSESSEAMSSEEIQQSNKLTESSQEQNTILYKGTVANQDDTSDNGLLVYDLVPVNREEAPGFDEVLLLMNETIPLTDKQTEKPVKLATIKKGDIVEVTLEEDAPTTMSIPPQIPGNSIIKVEVVSPE